MGRYSKKWAGKKEKFLERVSCHLPEYNLSQGKLKSILESIEYKKGIHLLGWLFWELKRDPEIQKVLRWGEQHSGSYAYDLYKIWGFFTWVNRPDVDEIQRAIAEEYDEIVESNPELKIKLGDKATVSRRHQVVLKAKEKEIKKLLGLKG